MIGAAARREDSGPWSSFLFVPLEGAGVPESVCRGQPEREVLGGELGKRAPPHAWALGRLLSGSLPGRPRPAWRESLAVSLLASRDHGRLRSRAAVTQSMAGGGGGPQGRRPRRAEGTVTGKRPKGTVWGTPLSRGQLGLRSWAWGCCGPLESNQQAGLAPPDPSSPAAWLSHKPPGHRKKWRKPTCWMCLLAPVMCTALGAQAVFLRSCPQREKLGRTAEAGARGRGDCQPARGSESVGFETGRTLLETWLPVSFIHSPAWLCTPAVHLPLPRGLEIQWSVDRKVNLCFH